MSIYRLTLSLFLGASIIFYFFFWVTLNDQREQTARLMNDSLRNDLSEIAYEMSKKASSLNEINTFKAMLDRKAARKDLIQSILVAHGSRVLLYTDPRQRAIPASENILTDISRASLNTLLEKRAYELESQFFNHLTPVRLRVLILTDETYISNRLSRDIDTLLYVQGLPPVIILLTLWLLLNRTIAKPLEQLRRYAYDPLFVPDKIHVTELESIRQTMQETFERLDYERDELYRRSVTDELSGLANRNFLNGELQRILSDAKRHDHEIAVMILDVDNFKSVNDTLGHEAGDALISLLAEKLREIFRTHDVISRIGGDEFAIVLRNHNSRSELIQVLTRLLDNMNRSWLIHDTRFHLSVSIGVSLYPLNGEDAVTLLKNADIAMYEAKKNGKGNFHFYSEALNNAIMEEVSLDRDMRSGLQRQEFELYYQAKTRVPDNKVTGTEALLRWRHPAKGFIPPSVFLPIAERTGFIIDIGKWVIAEAIKQQLDWKKLGYDISVSINLSAVQFRDEGLYNFINRVLENTAAEPAKIDFEITESIFLDSTDRNLEVLNRLHKLGVTISLDDFGTGYASLSYLKVYPIDKLKIDKLFIDDFASETGSTFLQTMVSMGHTLGMEVIAEGIEKKAQLDYLKTISCDTYQGFYCCKPMPPHDLIEILKRREQGPDNIVVFNRDK
jgi:diguanylate cyclase (GGDEF)-like protein